MKLKYWIVLVILMVTGAVTGYGLLGVQQNTSRGKAFELIRQGMSKAEVIAIMGEPEVVRSKCRDDPTWLDQPASQHICAEEFQYDARFVPKFWSVGFDSTGTAIAKYLYVSP